MARTDYGAILSTVIKDTSDAIREVKGSTALISPAEWGNEIRSISGGGIDDILEHGQVSTTSSYATANFSDVSDYDYLFVKVYYDYNGVLKEYTTVVDVSTFDIDSTIDVYAATQEIGHVGVRLTKTSIACYSYGGAWRDIYCDVKATRLQIWE